MRGVWRDDGLLLTQFAEGAMTAAFDDYKVPFRREEMLARDASAIRQAYGNENDGYFNIVKLVLWLSKGVSHPRLKFRPFAIEFFDMQEGEKPATLRTIRQRFMSIERYGSWLT